MFKYSLILLLFCFGHSQVYCSETNFISSKEKKLQFFAYRNEPTDTTYDEKCMPCTPSDRDEGSVAFTKHWKIVLVTNQSYLGRLVIISQRHFATYEEMNDDEADEYREIFKQLLPALKKTYNVTHFNVAYLMNGAFNAQKPDPAFKDGRPNPHFHWHVIPRYDGPREFHGEIFEDPDFGKSFDLHRKKYLVGEFKKKSIESLRNNLDITYLP